MIRKKMPPRSLQADGEHWQNESLKGRREANVAVHRDDKLADTLSRLEIGDMIPPELYEVVAEILVFVDAMDKIKAKMDAHKK